jgi:hypothetical protein
MSWPVLPNRSTLVVTMQAVVGKSSLTAGFAGRKTADIANHVKVRILESPLDSTGNL